MRGIGLVWQWAELNYRFFADRLRWHRSGRRFKVIHHMDRASVEEMYRNYCAVFVLSTGRAGSAFMARLFERSGEVVAFHEPEPTLHYFCDYAFHNQDQEEVLAKMVEGARLEFLLRVFNQNKIYLESNQCMSYFAPQLARVFRGARFIHVVRHPGDFTRSAVRKGWYANDSIWEAGRIKLADGERWARMNQIEKAAWMWRETNGFIERFKQDIDDPGRIITVKLEEITEDVDRAMEMLRFAGDTTINASMIARIQAVRVNTVNIGSDEPDSMKKVAAFPRYADWESSQKNAFKAIVAPLAEAYGYEL